MLTFDKEVKEGKTQRFEYDVSSWSSGAALISASAVSELGLVTLSACDISGGKIGFYATGASVGRDIIHVTYATISQSDCDNLSIYVERC